MKTKILAFLLSFGLVACSEEILDYRNAETVNNQIYAQGANSSFTGKLTNVPYTLIQTKEFGTILKVYEATTGDAKLVSALLISGINALGNVQQKNSLLLCNIEVNNGIFDGDASCHLNGKEATILKYKYSKGKIDGTLTWNMPTNKNEDVGGFAFEVQLSLTEKGQYEVAYGLSCEKDCHELHTTDPRRTIPHPIPVTPLHRHRNRQTA